MPGTLRESMALLTESYDKWDLLGMNFTNDLYNRMLHDDDRLPHFPYRDDGKLIWGIIEEWVDSYVKAFYKSDADVLNDLELQVCCPCTIQHLKLSGSPKMRSLFSLLIETSVLH